MLHRVHLHRALAAFPAALILFGVAACNTTAPTAAAPIVTPQRTRIAELQADYHALSATAQKQVAEGVVARDFDMKSVYIALGRPDHIVTTPNAKAITWTYDRYVPPVVSTNKVITGNDPRSIQARNSPLFDTMDAWNNGMQKHEIIEAGNTEIIAKAPTQSWGEYSKYRKNYEMAGTPAAKAAIRERARQEYHAALRIPPITSPDPVKLSVLFVDQHVTDVIIDESQSAFSDRALSLPGARLPTDQTGDSP